jgi:hypothetical protein
MRTVASTARSAWEAYAAATIDVRLHSILDSILTLIDANSGATDSDHRATQDAVLSGKTIRVDHAVLTWQTAEALTSAAVDVRFQSVLERRRNTMR